MHECFDHVRDRRGTNSLKWDRYDSDRVIPMWVADMDFAAPPAVLDAVQACVNHGIFGYPVPGDGLIDAVRTYLWTHYDWEVDPSWMVWLPGVVPGLNLACRALTDSGEAVMTATPIYPPFLSAPRWSGRELICAPLAKTADRWVLDMDTIADLTTASTRLFMLCNPHNPVGRAFSGAELRALADHCLARDMVICSDDIHCGLVLDSVPHVPVATLSPEIADRTITFMAPSKTYNTPGLACAFAIISNADLRQRFKRAMRGLVTGVNACGLAACEAAYRHAESWRLDLLDYLRGNRGLVERVVTHEIPGIHVTHIEATYLAWLNVRDLGLDQPVRFFEKAGLGLSDGTPFGDADYVRLNFGCPRDLLREGLKRLASRP